MNDIYWVDPSRDSVIVRWERYAGQNVGRNLWAQIDIQYENATFGWLPRSWRITHYVPGEDTIQKAEELLVSSFEINPALEVGQFQADPSPGQIVEDVGKKKFYRVKGDGSLFEVDPTQKDEANRNWFLPLTIIVTVLVIVIVGIGYYRRKQMEQK